MEQSRMDKPETLARLGTHIHKMKSNKAKTKHKTLKTKKTGDVKYTSLKLVKKMRKRTSHL